MCVSGGDGLYDDAARVVVEIAATLRDDGPRVGNLAIALARQIGRLRPTQPDGTTTIRAPPAVAKILAGLAHMDAYPSIQHQWRQVRQQGQLCLASANPRTGFVWADRAWSLAHACRHGSRWGDVGPQLNSLPALLLDIDECPVCLNDFDDPLPSTDQHARTVEGLFTCTHAVCRKCDARIQLDPRPRCPLCRAERDAWVARRP